MTITSDEKGRAHQCANTDEPKARTSPIEGSTQYITLLQGMKGTGNCGLTPPTNRGVETTFTQERIAVSVGVDWLTLTGKRERLQGVLEGLKAAGVVECWEEKQAGAFFDTRTVLGDGLTLKVGHESEASWWCLEVSGSGCRRMGADLLWAMCREWAALPGIRCTRLDLAVDLRGNLGGMIGRVQEACEKGCLCRVRRWRPYMSHDGQQVIGETVYIGGRTSERQLRVYDKGLETATGERGEWVRWELQARKKVANELWHGYSGTETEEKGMEYAAGQVCAFVDFREGKEGIEMSRRKRLAWWSELLETMCGGEHERVTVPQLKHGPGEYVRWLREQVGPVLAAVCAEPELQGFESPGMVLDLLLDGMEIRRSERDRAKVRALARICAERLQERGSWLGNDV